MKLKKRSNRKSKKNSNKKSKKKPRANRKKAPAECLTKTIDHLGLVAGMCDEIGLTRLVDQMIPPDQRAELSVGECLKLMIVNAMGFTARPLYLEAEDFSQRPLKQLSGRDISAKKITDDRLGRSLDRLYETGCDSLFSTGACAAYKQFRIDSTFLHLDTTSISVHGQYKNGTGLIEYGYSKDGQPGLKQFMISLTSSRDGDVPVLSKALAETPRKHLGQSPFYKHLQKVKPEIRDMKEPAYYVRTAPAIPKRPSEQSRNQSTGCHESPKPFRQQE